MINKRDELALQHKHDFEKSNESFKAGWDACEKELLEMNQFGWQCYQDRCEGALVEASVAKILNGELKVQEGICRLLQKSLDKDAERLHKLQSECDKLGVALEYLQFECRQACHYDLLEIIDEALRKDG